MPMAKSNDTNELPTVQSFSIPDELLGDSPEERANVLQQLMRDAGVEDYTVEWDGVGPSNENNHGAGVGLTPTPVSRDSASPLRGDSDRENSLEASRRCPSCEGLKRECTECGGSARVVDPGWSCSDMEEITGVWIDECPKKERIVWGSALAKKNLPKIQKGVEPAITVEEAKAALKDVFVPSAARGSRQDAGVNRLRDEA